MKQTLLKIHVVLLTLIFLLPMGLVATSIGSAKTISDNSSFTSGVTTAPQVLQPNFNSPFSYDESKLDGLLLQWIESKVLPDGVYTKKGHPSIVLITTAEDDFTFGGKLDVVGKIRLSEGVTWVHGIVDTLVDVATLSLDARIHRIEADSLMVGTEYMNSFSEIDSFKRGSVLDITPFEESMPVDEVSPLPIDTYSTRELIGAEDAYELGVEGEGALIQIQDTGLDFGHDQLYGAMAVDVNGDPAPLVASGRGFSMSHLFSNDYWTYYVPNPAIASLFTDTLHTDASGYINLTGFYDTNGTFCLEVYSPEYDYFFSLDDLGFYDAEGFYLVPDYYYVGNIVGNQTGFAFGISMVANGISGHFSFVPFILADANNDGDFDSMYADYETGYLMTLWWYYYISDAVFWYYSPFDFSIQVAHTNAANQYLSKDIGDEIDFYYGMGLGHLDGHTDISLGGLASSMDHLYNFSGNALPIVKGINPNGKLFGHIYDTDGHGTACAGNALGRSGSYQLFKNYGTKSESEDIYYDIHGIAPKAKLMATPSFATTAITYGWMYAAGFEPIDENNNWEFVPGCGHIANMSSNSWGRSNFHDGGIVNGWDIETMLIDYLSVPGFLGSNYPGILFLTSSGNGGPGLGTNRGTGQSTLTVQVGASTNNWVRQIWGYNETEHPSDTIIGWSNSGPSQIGYPTQDVVNVGAFDYSITPVDWWRPARDGGYYNYDYHGGTSQACPMTAGVVALIIDAWSQTHPGVALNPMMAKTILTSTAKDLGYDPYQQGSGRADALRAVEYALSTADVLMAYVVNSSATNAVGRYDPIFEFYNGIEHPAINYTTIDGSLYYGTLAAGDSSGLEFEVQEATAALPDLDFSAKTLTEWYSEQYDGVLTLDEYTDFNINDLFSLSQIQQGDLVEISMAISIEDYNLLTADGTRAPIVYIQGFDGEDYHFINYAYGDSNYQTLYLPTWIFNNNTWSYIIRARDYSGGGTSVNFGIRVFNWTVDTQMVVSPIDSDTFLATLATDVNQIPGMYNGFIVINSTDTNHILLPYGYSVFAVVEEYETDGWTEIGGLTGRVFDNGFIGCADYGWRPDTGDWRFFDFVLNDNIVDKDPRGLVVELEWKVPGSVMEIFILDALGFIVGESDYVTSGGHYYTYTTAPPTIERLVFDISLNLAPNLWTKQWENSTFTSYGWNLYSIAVHASSKEFMAGNYLTLEPFTLRLAWINVTDEAFTVPSANLAVSGILETPDGMDITNGNLTVEWTNVSTNPVPEFTNSPYGFDVIIYQGYTMELEFDLDVADLSGYSDDFYFEAGNVVTFYLGWDDFGVDYDFYMYDYYDNEYFGYAAATLANPEYAVVLIPESGYYYIEYEYYSGPGDPLTMNWDIIVQTGDSVYPYVGTPGIPREIDLSALADGPYLVDTYAYGWNFNYLAQYSFVYDSSAPEILEKPANDSIVFGDSIELIWYITEWSGTYDLYMDGAFINSGVFEGLTEISYEYDGDELGEHEFELIVEDALFGYSDHVFTNITVLNSPIAVYLESDGATLSWTAVDLTVDTDNSYNITIDGISVAIGNWSSGVAVAFDLTALTGLSIGNHAISIEFLDGYGESVSNTTNFIFTEKTVSTCSSPNTQWLGYIIGPIVGASVTVVVLLLLKKFRPKI